MIAENVSSIEFLCRILVKNIFSIFSNEIGKSKRSEHAFRNRIYTHSQTKVQRGHDSEIAVPPNS
jgi:hypothetical protein